VSVCGGPEGYTPVRICIKQTALRIRKQRPRSKHKFSPVEKSKVTGKRSLLLYYNNTHTAPLTHTAAGSSNYINSSQAALSPSTTNCKTAILQHCNTAILQHCNIAIAATLAPKDPAERPRNLWTMPMSTTRYCTCNAHRKQSPNHPVSQSDNCGN